MARREVHGSYERWNESGQNHGYSGPHRRAGFQQFSFLDAAGNAVGHWSGLEGTGHIDIPDAPPPAQETENG